ncbi:hypothetical protein EPA93_32035 [Ktedonosporobacter rubrisoli]|uniref:Uncharacterized protein n=1 Tax=Ktedonosporobacter rubrisoli TaxID=2509675 RepID=A0A4P6JY26_KTERU|nr:hypothetical protein [Ktedonosporobacter rubrisoli]QBD80353.1 hypothetical protein EPA93_32035 [Ktedonosporobacter rubrisoli]
MQSRPAEEICTELDMQADARLLQLIHDLAMAYGEPEPALELKQAWELLPASHRLSGSLDDTPLS